MASEHPGMRYVSSRCEHTKDGAGVDHYTLYAGYAPNIANPTEPLDPRNLNSSDRAEQIGDPARDNAIGMKEQRF
jgi:hypothetical protein